MIYRKENCTIHSPKILVDQRSVEEDLAVSLELFVVAAITRLNVLVPQEP